MVAWSKLTGNRVLPARLQRWRKHQTAGVPEYLARHYWWAYLTRGSVWVFDHPLIINAILFFQYRTLMNAAIARLHAGACGRFLQLTCVYGELIPSLYQNLDTDSFHVTDIAPVQLQSVRRKIFKRDARARLRMTRANVEQLPYVDDAFDTLQVFFLLHELPPDARRKVLREVLRVLKPGGHLLVVEYGELTQTHWLHRLWLFRWMLEFLEPYLGEFWLESLRDVLSDAADHSDKAFESVAEQPIFGGFYRLLDIRLAA